MYLITDGELRLRKIYKWVLGGPIYFSRLFCWVLDTKDVLCLLCYYTRIL